MEKLLLGNRTYSYFDYSFSPSLMPVIKTRKLLHNEFLKQLLNSQTYKTLANNSVLMGGGVGNLNVNVVREFPNPIPPMEAQITIAKTLINMDFEIEHLENKLVKATVSSKG
jgi:type I restriction enzyme, S subunit